MKQGTKRKKKAKAREPDSKGELACLQAVLREFVRARDWEKFHTPKNLVMALTGEVGELTELFQWLSPEESLRVMASDELAVKVRDELADVFVYCLRLADVLGIDVGSAILAKSKKNASKYPVALSRGHARKYTEIRPTVPRVKRVAGRSRP